MKSRGTQNETYFFWWYRRAAKIPFGAHVHIVIATDTLWAKTGTKICQRLATNINMQLDIGISSKHYLLIFAYQHGEHQQQWDEICHIFLTITMPVRNCTSRSKTLPHWDNCITILPSMCAKKQAWPPPWKNHESTPLFVTKNIWQNSRFGFVCSTPPTRTSGKIHSVITLILRFTLWKCGRKRHLSSQSGSQTGYVLSPALCFGCYGVSMEVPQRLNIILFADDFLVRLKHEDELVCMLQVLCAELSKVGVKLFLCQNVNVPHTGDECSRCGHSTVNLLMRRKPIASTNALEENTMVICRFPQALLGTVPPS